MPVPSMLLPTTYCPVPPVPPVDDLPADVRVGPELRPRPLVPTGETSRRRSRRREIVQQGNPAEGTGHDGEDRVR